MLKRRQLYGSKKRERAAEIQREIALEIDGLLERWIDLESPPQDLVHTSVKVYNPGTIVFSLDGAGLGEKHREIVKYFADHGYCIDVKHDIGVTTTTIYDPEIADEVDKIPTSLALTFGGIIVASLAAFAAVGYYFARQ